MPDILITCGFCVCVVVVLLSFCLVVLSYWLRGAQDRLLYHPGTPADSTVVCESPADKGYFNSENVHIRTADGVTLRGFIMWPLAGQQQQQQQQSSPHPGDMRNGSGLQSRRSALGAVGSHGETLAAATLGDAVTVSPLYAIVYFHGNAGNVGHRIPIALLLTSRLPCVVLMMDYRGYGLSDAVPPTEGGLKLDAQACLEYVWNHTRIPQEHIFIMGTSLGGAVAIHLASQEMNAKRIAGVIVENSFTSISDMASVLACEVIRHFFPHSSSFFYYLFEYYVKPLCLRIGWKSISLVHKVKAPILFISGQKDELIPPSQMRRLYLKSLSSTFMRKFVEFSDGMHNTMSFLTGYTETIDRFVQEVICLEEGLV